MRLSPPFVARPRTKRVPVPSVAAAIDHSMKQGFTLTELVLVFAVAAILLGIGVTNLVRAVDQLRVEAAATQVVAAHQRARMLAVARGQVLTLLVDSMILSITPRTTTIPLWSAAGPADAGVALAGPSRRFTFSPEGFTLGLSNASLQLQRGATSRTIVVSRLGRVRVLR